MKHWSRRFGVVLLALGLLVASSAPVTANWSAPTPTASLWDIDEQLVVPYLPNNETLAGTGPWHGTVTVANASNFPVTVDIAKADGSPITSVNLPGNGSTTLAAGTLFGSNPGGGLLLSGREQGGCASQAVQEFIQTRGTPANTADTIALPVPSGVNVTQVVVSQGTTLYAPANYIVSQAGTTLNINWAPVGPEPAVGSAYSVQVAYDRPCRPARLSAAVKLMAPAPSTNGRTSSTHLMVSGYAGLSRASAVGSTLVAPIAQANYSGWKTVLHVTNVGSTPCSVTAKLYQHPSGTQTHTLTQAVAAGATWNLDLVAAGVPNNWLGTARIEGVGCQLTASIDRIKPTQPWGTPVNMALTNLALPAGSLTSTVYVPLVFQAYFDWNTGLAVTNAGGGPATVTINYYGTNGNLITTKSLGPIASNSMDFDYLSGSGGQLAQAVITSTQPIIVSVDAVKYTGGGSDVGQALTSMGINGPLTLTPGLPMPLLRVPLFQKQGSSGNDNSGIQLFNVGGAAATVTLDFFDASGAPQPPSPLTVPGIAPNGAVTIYAPSQAPLPADFQGQVRVAVIAGGPVVAITNNVNYDVQADGSAAFNVATGQRALRVDFGKVANKNGVDTIIVAQTVDEDGLQMPAQQILVQGAGLTITTSPAFTNMFGAVTVLVKGTNTTVPVTVCWDLNNNGSCQTGEPQVTQTMSWTS